MKRSKRITLSTLLCLIPALVTTAALADDHKIRRVLVISIDGMHALDFALWTKNNPASALANLAENLFQVPRASLKFTSLAEQFKDLGKNE